MHVVLLAERPCKLPGEHLLGGTDCEATVGVSRRLIHLLQRVIELPDAAMPMQRMVAERLVATIATELGDPAAAGGGNILSSQVPPNA